MGVVTRSDSCACVADRNASSKYPPLAVPPVVRIVLMQTRGIYMVGRVGSEHGIESEQRFKNSEGTKSIKECITVSGK